MGSRRFLARTGALGNLPRGAGAAIMGTMSAEGTIAVRDRVAALIRWILTDGRASPSPARFVRRAVPAPRRGGRAAVAGDDLCRDAPPANPRLRLALVGEPPRHRGSARRPGRRSHRGLSPQPDARRDRDRRRPLRRRLDGESRASSRCSTSSRATAARNIWRCRSTGSGSAFRWCPGRPSGADGFAAGDVALLEEIRPALAARDRGGVVRRTARSLFSIYHGRQVGDRIFDGQILRGAFRAAARRHHGDRPARLHRHLRPAAGRGGDRRARRIFRACRRARPRRGRPHPQIHRRRRARDLRRRGRPRRRRGAAGLAAARAIVARLAERNAGPRRAAGRLRAGIGLHLGTVMYGNVGSPDRLDFTAIGPGGQSRLPAEGPDQGAAARRCWPRAISPRRPATRSLRSRGARAIRGLSEVEERCSACPSTIRGRPAERRFPFGNSRRIG